MKSYPLFITPPGSALCSPSGTFCRSPSRPTEDDAACRTWALPEVGCDSGAVSEWIRASSAAWRLTVSSSAVPVTSDALKCFFSLPIILKIVTPSAVLAVWHKEPVRVYKYGGKPGCRAGKVRGILTAVHGDMFVRLAVSFIRVLIQPLLPFYMTEA